MSKPILGILLGEAAGIGPEIIAKLCARKRLERWCNPILIGDLRVLSMAKKIANVDFPVSPISCISHVCWNDGVPLLDQANFDPVHLAMGTIDPCSGRITGDMLVVALRLAQRGAIDGFVYAPLNKAALAAGGYSFEDEQKLMASYLNLQGRFGEMNVLHSLWTFRVTSHIPLMEVAKHLSAEEILEACRLAHVTLRKAGITSPRLAVAALNPHAGENGLCGREEIDIIAPAVRMAQKEGINVVGPYPSDTVFLKAFEGLYDAVITMYHDQGQIAIKLKGFKDGVTVAAGFPFPIATPAHGTAFDIAGKGKAKTDATEKAVQIAARMASSKKQQKIHE